MRVRRCKRIKWVWIFEILSLFWALFLFAQSSTSAFRIGCHWYTHGWCSSASSSCQPPGNWYNVRHNLFHIHSSLKRIPFRVGLSLAALQFSIGWHANGSHFESVGFHHIKKCALLKQILLTLERFYLCEINVQVRAHTHSQTLTLLLVPALWVSTYISHVYPFFTFIPFQSHSSRLLSSCWSHRVLPYIFTCHPPEYDDYDNDELQHINELFCQTK